MTLLRQIHSAVARSPLADHAARSGWGTVQRAFRPRKLARLATDDLRVMVGAGPCVRPGWLATDMMPSRRDVVFLDATKSLPFADSTVRLIHAEHVLEHISFDDGQRFMAECARVLVPGGRVRLSTPDYDRVLALASNPELRDFVRQDNEARGVPVEHVDDPVFVVNALFSEWGHRFLYTEELLRECLVRAGLSNVTRWDVGKSDLPELCGLELHGHRIGREWNDYQSLVVEATFVGGRA